MDSITDHMVDSFYASLKLREINPERLDDHVFWDIEALKLAVCWPDIYRKYIVIRSLGRNNGATGLWRLGFITSTEQKQIFDRARIANFGVPLIEACLRLSDKVI